ncbi:MAG: 3'-5' exonuclease [Plesiomonas shigelloides]
MKHVMLDLETMGKGSRAAIVSIGAVFFEPFTGELGAEFEVAIDLRDSAEYGKVDAETVLWWLAQSDEARAKVYEGTEAGNRLFLCHALKMFSEFVERNSSDHVFVWGNGAGFDNVILSNAYEAVGLEKPWSHWKDCDVRTVVNMGRDILGIDPKRDLPFEGERHTALADAKHQARYVSEIYISFDKNNQTQKS